MSMLNAEASSGREIKFVHAALNSNVHAFKNDVINIAKQFNNVQPFYIYNEPTTTCRPDAEGFISKDLLASLIPSNRDVEFYFLGPKGFMQAAMKIAKELNIPEQQIHYEFFGPKEELAA